jgi:thioredoxin-related protein
MKTDIYKRIELATNIAILVVAGLLCMVLVKNYLIPKSASTTDNVANSNQEQLKADAKLSITEIDWANNGQTLLLALSTTCHYCTESAPFYQRLIKERGSNTRIVAVLPQSISDSQDYLNRLGLSVDEIKQASLKSINVRGTPTLMLVNGDGVVVSQWLGRLPVNQEAEVLSKVQSDRIRN